MRKILVPLLFLFILLAFVLIGPDAPADAPAQAVEESQGAEPPAEDEEPPETFVPSEKLPADSAISFPVDI